MWSLGLIQISSTLLSFAHQLSIISGWCFVNLKHWWRHCHYTIQIYTTLIQYSKVISPTLCPMVCQHIPLNLNLISTSNPLSAHSPAHLNPSNALPHTFFERRDDEVWSQPKVCNGLQLHSSATTLCELWSQHDLEYVRLIDKVWWLTIKKKPFTYLTSTLEWNSRQVNPFSVQFYKQSICKAYIAA